MKNITNLCIDLQEGKISKKDFLREARRTFPNYITNVNTFEDTIKIFKAKSLIAEGCNCESQLDEAIPRDEEYDDHINFDTDNLKIPKRSLRIDRDTVKPAAPSEEDLEILRNLDIYGNEDMVEDDFNWVDLNENPEEDEDEDEDDYEWKIDKDDDYDIEDDYIADLELIDFDNETLREIKEPKFKPMGSKWDGSDSKYNGIEGKDEVDPLEQQIGMRYERSIDPTGTIEKWMKKVKSNLSKHSYYYTKLLLAGGDIKKIEPEVKKRTDLPVEMDKKMSNTTDKLNKMENPKGVEKDKASANKAKKETTPKIKVKDLTHKAVRAKGIKGVMDMTGGKMKKVKAINELGINDPVALYNKRKAEAEQGINELEVQKPIQTINHSYEDEDGGFNSIIYGVISSDIFYGKIVTYELAYKMYQNYIDEQDAPPYSISLNDFKNEAKNEAKNGKIIRYWDGDMEAYVVFFLNGFKFFDSENSDDPKRDAFNLKNKINLKNKKSINELEVDNTGILSKVQNFIDTKCPDECQNIRLTEKNLKVYLKYDYWDELPTHILSELETKFNIKVESSNEGEDGTKTYYVLSPKITSDMMQEIKKRIKKLLKK